MTDNFQQYEQDSLERAKQELQTAIATGFTVESFITGPVGQYLVARAEAERQMLLESFVAVDPTDTKAIAQMQARIGILDCWQQWVADAITEGIQAQQQFVDIAG